MTRPGSNRCRARSQIAAVGVSGGPRACELSRAGFGDRGPFGPGLRVTCFATDEHLVLAWDVECHRRGRFRTRQALRTGRHHRRDVRRSLEPIPSQVQRYHFDRDVEEMVVVTLVSDNGFESRVLLFDEGERLDAWLAALS